MHSDQHIRPRPAALGDVRSEVGTLRRVLVHRPGRELDHLTPTNAAGFLFDDVLRSETARVEHDALTATMREQGIEVIYLEDLIAGAMTAPADHVPGLIAGDRGGLPLPNLMFVRDTSAWLGSALMLGALANPVRRGECELVERAYAGHPAFADHPFAARPLRAAGVEGGDLFCLGEGAVLVGVGSRSATGAVEELADRLFACGFERVLVVEIPAERASIHLDCLMTLVDIDLLLIDRRLRGKPVVEILPLDGPVVSRIHLDIEAALADALGLEAIRVVEVADEREQWTLAANTLALRPGCVVTYAHNARTNEALAAAGVEILTVPGEELSHGHGGPRCLTCPISRDAVPVPSAGLRARRPGPGASGPPL